MTTSRASNATPESYSEYRHRALLLAAFASVSANAVPAEPIGLRVSPVVAPSSNQISIIETDVLTARIMSSLQQLADYLVRSQEEWNSDDKRILYENLWDLYDC